MTNSIQTASEDAYRLQFHLMPPKGWLNDPNGLCQMNGRYHVYFQYAPTSADGSGDKCWGHYESEDLIHWVYTGIAIYPDKLNHKLDASGAYSGSALVENGVMYLYYTGNVKLPGDYDYTTSGRLSNTILITSEDGIHLSEKECVVDNKDYPEHYSCHIRDPKVWKYKESYYMVLGARTRKDTGAVILYVSKDKKNWELLKEISTKEKFGYMWECPDIFEVDGTCLLSISPQGLKREEYKNQNIYQSGYFKLPYTMDEIVDPNCEITDLGDFMEWDMGFDFYAPQTFEDEAGRRLLIGWCGLPDIDEEYTNKTVETGWQHALSLPRKVLIRDGHVCQMPHDEFNELRRKKSHILIQGEETIREIGDTFDLELKNATNNAFTVTIDEHLQLLYENGCFTMSFDDANISGGRTERKLLCDQVRKMRVVADTSLLEVYLNDGESVFTTRFYPNSSSIQVRSKNCILDVWELVGMSMNIKEEEMGENE